MAGMPEGGMDGEADDFFIDEDGDLMPVCPEDWVPCLPMQTRVQSLAVVTEEVSGDINLRMFGTPTPALLRLLITVSLGQCPLLH